MHQFWVRDILASFAFSKISTRWRKRHIAVNIPKTQSAWWSRVTFVHEFATSAIMSWTVHFSSQICSRRKPKVIAANMKRNWDLEWRFKRRKKMGRVHTSATKRTAPRQKAEKRSIYTIQYFQDSKFFFITSRISKYEFGIQEQAFMLGNCYAANVRFPPFLWGCWALQAS